MLVGPSATIAGDEKRDAGETSMLGEFVEQEKVTWGFFPFSSRTIAGSAKMAVSSERENIRLGSPLTGDITHLEVLTNGITTLIASHVARGRIIFIRSG